MNSCCFISLSSASSNIKQTNATNDISFLIEEYLKSKVGNRIDLENINLRSEKNLKENQEFIIS